MAFCRMQRTLPCQACARQLNGHCKQRHNWWDGARRDQCQKPWSGAVVVGHRIATRSTRLGSSKPQGLLRLLRRLPGNGEETVRFIKGIQFLPRLPQQGDAGQTRQRGKAWPCPWTLSECLSMLQRHFRDERVRDAGFMVV